MDRDSLNLTLDQRSAVPLYEQICQQIREKIENRHLKPGTLLPTNHELRARLQVNYKTAQQAMATLAREGYVTRQARRGTVVKGVPRRGVVAIYSHIELFDPDGRFEYYRLCVSHLSRQLAELGRVHRLYLGSPTQMSNAAADDLLRHMSGGTLRGALLLNTPPHLEELLRLSRELRIPIVAMCGWTDVDYSVRLDHRSSVRVAAGHLKRQGRKRVGVIYNRSSASFADAGVLSEILEQSGLPANPSWVVGEVDCEQGGYDAAARIPWGDIDGVIVEDDVMALGVDRYLAQNGVGTRVPAELGLTTLWNHGSRLRLSLPFDRIEFDVEAQMRLGLELLQSAIDGQRVAESHVKITPKHQLTQGMNLSLRSGIS